MTSFKKGDKVIAISSWDGKGAFYARKLTIQSWGKLHGTATIEVNGKFIKQRIFTDIQTNYFLDNGFDVEAKALELAAEFIEYNKNYNFGKIGNTVFYQPAVKEEYEYFCNAKPSFLGFK